jgi:hypothetical protein
MKDRLRVAQLTLFYMSAICCSTVRGRLMPRSNASNSQNWMKRQSTTWATTGRIETENQKAEPFASGLAEKVAQS